MQSAYRRFQSTETALLLRVFNDTKQEVVLLMIDKGYNIDMVYAEQFWTGSDRIFQTQHNWSEFRKLICLIKYS